MATEKLNLLCTERCTGSAQLSPTTIFSPTHPSAILLKTHNPNQQSRPVAPNVAGSNPVSHPKNKSSVVSFQSSVKPRQLCDLLSAIDLKKHRTNHRAEHFWPFLSYYVRLRKGRFEPRRLGAPMSETPNSKTQLTPAQQYLNDLWDEHIRDEFADKDASATVDTMVPDAYVNHIPVLTGGVGREQLKEFYSKHFIPKMPPDTEIVPISRTVGDERLVDEMIFRFTHTIEMDWMLPGVAPTGKRVECPLVVIVHFRDGKLANEHIYWDQASVLVQLGLLEAAGLPVAGVEAAEKLADPTRPSNRLIQRARAAKA
jgi:carboxymethylenebutenolidase